MPSSTTGERTGGSLSRRDQILREAARLFAARGFHGVGVDEIGAAVGISGPGLYRHFAGKDSMLAELLVGISGRLLAEGRRREADAADAGAALDSLVRGHIDFALDDQPLITLHDRELDRLRSSDRKLVRQLQRQYVELWVEVVRARYAGLAEPDARAAVHAVFGLLNSTPHSAAHTGGPRSPALPGRAAMAELLRRLALGAFGAAAVDGAAADGQAGSGGRTASGQGRAARSGGRGGVAGRRGDGPGDGAFPEGAG